MLRPRIWSWSMNNLVVGWTLPAVRARWGLAPVRIRSCWANNKKRGIHLDSSFESGRRGSNPRPSAWKANALSTELLPQFLWAVMDSNHRRRKSAELQSAPFGHSGNCPHYFLLRCKGTINFVTCKKNLSFLLQ